MAQIMKEISILVGGKTRDGRAIITVKYANDIFFKLGRKRAGHRRSAEPNVSGFMKDDAMHEAIQDIVKAMQDLKNYLF